MRNLNTVLPIRVLAVSFSMLIGSGALAVDLPTVAPSSPLQNGACFASRCFPTSVALDVNTAAYGNTDPAVSVYRRTGGSWQIEQILTNPDFTLPTTPEQIQRALPFPPFGSPLGLSGDWLLAAGTSAKYNFKNVVYVMRRSGGTWQHIQTLALTRSQEAANTLVTSIATYDDVALIAEIETETSTPRSQVEVFIRRADGTYLRRAVIRPPTVAGGEGYQVSIFGDFALIGNPSAANGSGRAYLYERSSGGWLLRKTFAPAPGIVGARLGTAVAIKETSLAFSAPNQPIAPHVFGAIHVYACEFTPERPTCNWDQTLTVPQLDTSPDITSPQPTDGWQFGQLLTFDGNRLLASTAQRDWVLPPLAYLFERGANGWTQTAKISDGNSTLFTHGLLIVGSTLLLSSADAAYNTPVYVFQLPAVGSTP